MNAAGAFGSLAASPFHPGEHLPYHEAVLADLGPLFHMAGCWLDPLRLIWLEEFFRRVQDERTGERNKIFKTFTHYCSRCLQMSWKMTLAWTNLRRKSENPNLPQRLIWKCMNKCMKESLGIYVNCILLFQLSLYFGSQVSFWKSSNVLCYMFIVHCLFLWWNLFHYIYVYIGPTHYGSHTGYLWTTCI